MAVKITSYDAVLGIGVRVHVRSHVIPYAIGALMVSSATRQASNTENDKMLHTYTLGSIVPVLLSATPVITLKAVLVV